MSEPNQPIAAPPAIIVIFGAAGDLTKRKLIPALFNLASQQLLSSQVAMVGIDRVEMDSESSAKGSNPISVTVSTRRCGRGMSARLITWQVIFVMQRVISN